MQIISIELESGVNNNVIIAILYQVINGYRSKLAKLCNMNRSLVYQKHDDENNKKKGRVENDISNT
jgi:hypothetical protein